MIQVAVRNKYSFNMQLSSQPMAALGSIECPRNTRKTGDNDGIGAGIPEPVHINV
jgi:hypothetical protein